ncbi:hypothetical protein N7495_002262 [Penicillium taxi]|uniref:uncharacterized protein n=1 Tax=Penicillium taxi TaxID=168475 RepID=UPI002545021E|nr:uncharacterized protein N7495_002262 [Penicillium taxi]KAJ5901734.1 hypothetical protein N7495_002262 [Penicillium taxi]
MQFVWFLHSPRLWQLPCSMNHVEFCHVSETLCRHACTGFKCWCDEPSYLLNVGGVIGVQIRKSWRPYGMMSTMYDSRGSLSAIGVVAVVHWSLIYPPGLASGRAQSRNL